jgi:transcriptional regulator with XRE-family HTH domain
MLALSYRKELRMGFGDNLQRLRLQAGLSQSGLASQTGIPVKTIQSWEIGRRTPRWIEMLAALAKGLNVSMEELTGARSNRTDMAAAPKKNARTRKAN